ncbi:MAG: flavin reductase family protein, partial [Leptospiraceae bacterium]|nr:flavin reductase family protein [Leptospiraceae bacterium]
KLSLSRFAAGVTVITYKDGNEYGGITVSSFTSLSLNPPLILFNIDKRNKSNEIFIKNQNFAVHILSKDQENISNSFASSKVNKDEFMKSLDYEEKEGVPIFKGALSTLICEKETIHDGGDHTIIIGKVLSASTDETKSPLLYYNRGYHSV